MKRLFAISYLGWNLLKVLFKRIVLRERRGLKEFRLYFSGDKFFPYPRTKKGTDAKNL